jgi:sec-independent protein translocase protein TatB
MFNIGGGELLVIMLVALIVLGPQRLPGAARQVGKVMGDLRRISSGFQEELKEAFDDDASARPRRREAAPLASTVAEIDGRPAPPTPSDELGAGSRGGTTEADEPAVAPAVAAALDEIVTPLDQSPAGPDAPPDPAPALPAEPPAEPDGLGDERAAS